jgi:hypothetical protein
MRISLCRQNKYFNVLVNEELLRITLNTIAQNKTLGLKFSNVAKRAPFYHDLPTLGLE